jgi:hypothetical protein
LLDLARRSSTEDSCIGVRMPAINHALSANDAALITNAACIPRSSATIPPIPAPTISIDPHTAPRSACARERSLAGTRFGTTALVIGS